MFRRWIGMSLAAVVLGVGGAVAVAQPAHAGWDDCPAGALCAWLGPNGTGGTPGKVYGNNNDLSIYTKFRYAESVANNGQRCDVNIYTGRSRTGNVQLLRRGYVWNLAGTPFYHHVYSNYWVC